MISMLILYPLVSLHPHNLFPPCNFPLTGPRNNRVSYQAIYHPKTVFFNFLVFLSRSENETFSIYGVYRRITIHMVHQYSMTNDPVNDTTVHCTYVLKFWNEHGGQGVPDWMSRRSRIFTSPSRRRQFTDIYWYLCGTKISINISK